MNEENRNKILNKKGQKNSNLISLNCASKDATIFLDSPWIHNKLTLSKKSIFSDNLVGGLTGLTL